MNNYGKEQELNLLQQDEGRQFDLAYSIMDRLIDDRIDMFGVVNTAAYLLEMGCTEEELLWLHFTQDTIDEAKVYEGED